LDRIHIYRAGVLESISSKLENSFLIVVVNRFQQVITMHTFTNSRQDDTVCLQ